MGVSTGLNRAARGGYAARGVVYVIVGALAVLAAIGAGQAENTRGALRELLNQPFGSVLLVVVGIGLFAFAGWRFIQAIGDPDGAGTDAKGLLVRVGHFASGLIHVGLAVFAISVVFSLSAGSGDGGGGDPTSGWLSWLFGHEWGRYIALALACIPIGIGVAHIYKAYKAGFEKYLRPGYNKAGVVKPVCRFALVARGVVFIVIGILALYGGGIYEASDAPGMEDALAWIQGLPFGWLALLAIGLGLIAFAIYAFVEAIFRRIGIEKAGV
ncbi:DUF1206 domain-containing protein [Amorphus orientalis]|uniref:Uncharacterized membrane protein YidH (DUF202 family) n=1 Tax=Amorphus orientalis TaxID=649198 RepID=A0AAE3VQW3_9HYPH|nr:DUF1206 domain-containing protein [Amorphus orientalis]MDQ0317064.1 uncharacterized membrane protein YidH (DUF202 family) [Amorphus orientalis]